MENSFEEILGKIDFFRNFHPEELKEIQKATTIQQRLSGELLFRKGDPCDCLYILTKGRIRQSFEQDDGGELFFTDIHAPSTLGAWEVLTGSTWSYTAFAKNDLTLHALPKKRLRELVKESCEREQFFFKLVVRSLEEYQLSKLLPRYFGELSCEERTAVLEKLEWIELSSGDSLCLSHYRGGLFLIILGHLRRFEGESCARAHFLEDYKAGDSFAPPSSPFLPATSGSFRAIRDTYLVYLSEEGFADLSLSHPKIVARLRQKHIEVTPGSHLGEERCVNIALIPLHPTIDGIVMSEKITLSLATLGSVRWLNQKMVEEAINIAFNESDEEVHLSSPSFLAWMDEQECHFDRMILLANYAFDSWTHQIINIADMIVFVADGNYPSKELTSLERRLFTMDSIQNKHTYLILLDRGERRHTVSSWLEHRSVQRHFFLDDRDQHSIERVARSITGRGIGVVLSGGAAHALAHVGVIRAIEELRIPIDFIGGTGTGALIAMWYAFDRFKSLDKVKALHLFSALEEFSFSLPFTESTLYKQLQELFGDQRIEELLLPVFSVSTKVETLDLFLFQEGLICDGVYASTAIPGILSPFTNDRGEQFIDGGVVDHLPEETMRTFAHGAELILSDLLLSRKILPLHQKTEIESSWHRFLNDWNPLVQRRILSSIKELLFDNVLLLNMQRQRILKQQEPLGTLIKIPFSNAPLFSADEMESLIDIGYNKAMESLLHLLEVRGHTMLYRR